jgi:hypothetical protein
MLDSDAYKKDVVPKLSTVLSKSQHRFRERDFVTRCERCECERNLAACLTKTVAGARNYRCAQCGDLLVTVGHPCDRTFQPTASSAEWWSIRPAADLFVIVGKSRLRIPPAPDRPVFGQPLL